MLKQKIVVGMPPYEAYPAGGMHALKVQADLKKWPPNAYPYAVIAKQATQPDNSKIWLAFCNSTQFGTFEYFTVYFERGRAKWIQKHD